MRFKGHAKLIDKCNVIARINGNDSFLAMKETIVTSCLHELIDRAAMHLTKAGITTAHLVSFDLEVHAREINEE
jgi:hypothetical protein